MINYSFMLKKKQLNTHTYKKKNNYCHFNILIISKYLEGIILLKYVCDFE